MKRKPPARHRTRAMRRPRAAPRAPHPQSVPILLAPDEATPPDQPFAAGASDALSPDLRHRLVSETAFHHLAERGFEAGSEVEDWTLAEGEVDHTLVNPVGKPSPSE